MNACISTIGKNLLSSNTSSTLPDNMVKFGPLTAEIGSGVCTPTNFSGFCVLAALDCMASSSGRQPNFAALNRGRHLCSAGRPSGWALAHILVISLSQIYCSVRRWKNFENRPAFGKVRGISTVEWHLFSEHDVYLFVHVGLLKHINVYFMVALWNRETIYIFMLWFVLLSFFSSPNLSRRRLDVCHTSTHGVALVRI